MLGPLVEYNAGNIEDIRSDIKIKDAGKCKFGK